MIYLGALILHEWIVTMLKIRSTISWPLSC